MESKRPLAPSDNFDMTLEECRLVFDTMDNLIIIDERGRIKYFSPNMYSMVEAYNKRPLPDKVVGKHVSEVHPATKILNAARSEKFDETCFYFASDVTNIARIKNLYRDGRLVGAIDYDIFTDGVELKEFLQKVSEYAEKGFINLQDTFQSMYETSKKQQTIKYCVTDIIGKSQAMTALRMQIAQVSESNSTVLVTGKTGCGKEMVAHSIHNLSRRCKRPMITINCAAIPEALVESELFGYEEGAYTGARRGGKKGKFELADKGVLFLDEITNMPLDMQAKLLRILQEGKLVPIGGTKLVAFDVQVIAATNKDIIQEIEAGNFRKDLFYRLNLIHIKVPPLRERGDDIRYFLDYFLRMYDPEGGKRLSREVTEILCRYDWPGNVRQLENVIERMVILSDGPIIGKNCIPGEIAGSMMELDGSGLLSLEGERSLDAVCREYVHRMVGHCDGNIKKAAGLLGISRATVYKYLKSEGTP